MQDKKINKRFFLIVLILFLIFLLLVFYINSYQKKLKAENSKAEIGFLNKEINLEKDSDFDIDLKINALEDKKISGVDLHFEIEDYNLIEYLGYNNLPENYFNDELINKVATESGKKIIRIAAFNKNSSDNLGSSLILKLKFKSKKAGESKIKINLDRSIIVGTSPSYFFDLLSESNFIKIKINNPVKLYNFDTKIRLQGVTNPISSNKEIKVTFILERSDFFGPKIEKDLTLKFLENGIFGNMVSFDLSLDDEVPYFIYIKPEKHLEKKFCENQPSESNFGEYLCNDPKIFLKEGINNLDFSKVYILAGDLPPKDNVINSYDTALIFNNLGKKNQEALEKADVNLDGVVDSQDYSLVIKALSIRR